MKSLRSYLTYIPLSQKIVQFVLMPLLSAALALLLVTAQKKLYPGLGMEDTGFPIFFSVYLLVFFAVCDVAFDRSNFGGTFSSDASWLEYMKTSPRGIPVYREILCGSMIARISYAVIITGIFRLILFCTGLQTLSGALSGWLFFAGGICLASQSGAFLARFFASEQTSMAAGMISTLLVSVLFALVSLLSTVRNIKEALAYAVAGLLALLAGIVLAVLLVAIGTKKKEKEYVDV